MSNTVPVGILGGSGLVGEQYHKIIAEHPFFECRFAPNRHSLLDFEAAKECQLIFSALPSSIAQDVEPEYAKRGFPVFSSASCYRMEEDIPLIIPEINPHHLKMIPQQQKNREWEGCIIAKPNCTLQSYLLPLFPLHQRFKLEKVAVTNLQAVSGAGRGLSLENNILPYIEGEEEKSEKEPQKILGEPVTISAHCVRVPVEKGHMACISASFKLAPSLREVREAWDTFEPLIYFEEEDRPQPLLDTQWGGGMSIAVGRLRTCPLLDIRFTAISNNLIRGAAGGGILTAQLYLEKYETITHF